MAELIDYSYSATGSSGTSGESGTSGTSGESGTSGTSPSGGTSGTFAVGEGYTIVVVDGLVQEVNGPL